MATKITVQTNAGGASYDDADGWTVDDRGDLHVLKKDANKSTTIATHAHGNWTSVARTSVPMSITYHRKGVK